MSDKYRKIGEVLAAARKDQKKSLKDASESTRIMEKYLEAIEAGNPKQLPTETYFLLFARSYAQFLGIDRAILDDIEMSNAEMAVEPTDISPEIHKEVETQKHARSFGRTLVIIISVVVVLFALLIFYNQWVLKPGSVSVNDEPDSPVTLEGGSKPGVSTGGNHAIEKIDYRPYQPPGPLAMTLRARQDVWAVVVVDGDTVMNRQLAAGESRSYEAKYRYLMTLGISTAVDITLNGHPVAPLTENPRTIAGLEINQVNYRDFLMRDIPAPAQTPATNESSNKADGPIEQSQSSAVPSPQTGEMDGN